MTWALAKWPAQSEEDTFGSGSTTHTVYDVSDGVSIDRAIC